MRSFFIIKMILKSKDVVFVSLINQNYIKLRRILSFARNAKKKIISLKILDH